MWMLAKNYISVNTFFFLSLAKKLAMVEEDNITSSILTFPNFKGSGQYFGSQVHPNLTIGKTLSDHMRGLKFSTEDRLFRIFCWLPLLVPWLLTVAPVTCTKRKAIILLRLIMFLDIQLK